MISVVIPTLNSERALLPALSALVPGSAEGLLREVILADGGSSDGTETIADAAGCDFHRREGSEPERVLSAAEAARSTWLMVLDPASVLEEGWTREVLKFIESAERSGEQHRRAAAFRFAVDGYGMAPRLKEWSAAALGTLTGRTRREQGLLLTKAHFRASRGRPGRVVVLRTRAILPG